MTARERHLSLLDKQQQIKAAFAELLGYGTLHNISFRQDRICEEAFAEAVSRWMDKKYDNPNILPMSSIEKMAEEYRNTYDISADQIEHFLREIMKYAVNLNVSIKGDVIRIRKIVDRSEIVIGVRFSPVESNEIECMLIKGTSDIREIIAASRSDRRRVVAIRCSSDEQSEMLQQIACEQSRAAAASL